MTFVWTTQQYFQHFKVELINTVCWKSWNRSCDGTGSTRNPRFIPQVPSLIFTQLRTPKLLGRLVLRFRKATLWFEKVESISEEMCNVGFCFSNRSCDGTGPTRNTRLIPQVQPFIFKPTAAQDAKTFRTFGIEILETWTV